jgi:hypothetical protein
LNVAIIRSMLATKNVKASEKSVSFSMAWWVAGWPLAPAAAQRRAADHATDVAVDRQVVHRPDKARRELDFFPKISWIEGIAQMTEIPPDGGPSTQPSERARRDSNL